MPKWYGRHWIFLRTDGSPTVAASTRHPLRHDFRNSPTTGRNNAVYGAAVRFEVRNVDFEVEAVVSLAHVTGKLTIEERDGSLKPTAGLQLNLQPKRIGPAQRATTAADGSFDFDRVGPNEYTVEFTGLPADAYIACLSRQRSTLPGKTSDALESVPKRRTLEKVERNESFRFVPYATLKSKCNVQRSIFGIFRRSITRRSSASY